MTTAAWLWRHNCLDFAAKGHMAVLQAAVEAVKLGTKESFSTTMMTFP